MHVLCIEGAARKKRTRKICEAFIAGNETSVGNLSTAIDGNISRLYLGDALIAESRPGQLRMTLAGNPSVETRDTLNALLQLLNIEKRFFHEGESHYLGSTVSRTSFEVTAHEWLTL